jgi:CRP/FNR family transcriptional regulator
MTTQSDGDDIFADLPRPVQAKVNAAVIPCRFATNEALFRAGTPATALFVVLEGRVRVSRETAGHVALLHVETAGGVLGEIPVFGGVNYPATAIAAEPTRCAKLPRAAVDRLLVEHPEFSRYAIARLATRAQSLLRRIDELTATTIVARVARHMQARAAEGDAFALGVTQAELAEELGTAREVIVRAIASLVRSGAVARAGRSRFVVRDRAMLQLLGGG